MSKKLANRDYFINRLRILTAMRPKGRYEVKALELQIDAVKLALGLLSPPPPPKEKTEADDGLTTLERMRRGRDAISNGQSSGS